MTIWFDMDGTIADLYGVENWLPKLRAHDSTPYLNAKPLLNLSSLARALNILTKRGIMIGIISWLSKDPDVEYARAVRNAKCKWLKRHLPSVIWDYVIIVPYGTSKSTITHASANDILFDDEENNIKDWEKAGGSAFNPSKIMEILKTLKGA